MREEPAVSVIIPVYNGERYLAEAIESVQSQTVRPAEIIVVDDGSTDGSEQAARRFRPAVRTYHQPHCGAGAARNRGVEEARGSMLAFLDSDDLWVPDKLERQVAALQDDPGLDMVFGHVQQFYSPDLSMEERERIRMPSEILPGYLVGAMLIRREAFFRVGLFKTDRQLAECIDWYSKAVEVGLKSLMLPAVVMKRRIHRANLGRQRHNKRGDYARVLKATLDRRRAANQVGTKP